MKVSPEEILYHRMADAEIDFMEKLEGEIPELCRMLDEEICQTVHERHDIDIDLLRKWLKADDLSTYECICKAYHEDVWGPEGEQAVLEKLNG